MRSPYARNRNRFMRRVGGRGVKSGMHRRRLRLEALEDRRLLTTYVVDSLADTTLTDGALTLREAIQAANNDAAFADAPAGSGADVIRFAPALFAGGPAELRLGGTELTVSDDLTITGPGSERLRIDAQASSRVFHVAAGVTAAFDQLTIAGGAAEQGGGLYAESGADVTLHSVVVAQNRAVGSQTTTHTCAEDKLLRYVPVVTDTSGNTVREALVGQSLRLEIYVQDLRDEPEGIFAPYMDVLYDPSLASIPTENAITYEEVYNWFTDGDTSTPGIIDELGGMHNLYLPDQTLNGSLYLFCRVDFVAEALGELTFTTDPADDVNFHQTLLVGIDVPVEISDICFEEYTISITTGGIPINGGGIYAVNAAVDIENSLFIANAAQDIGGGIYGVGDSCQITIANSTVIANAAGSAGGIGTGLSAGLVVRNTIVAMNDGYTNSDISPASTAVLSASHSLIGNGTGLPGISDGINGNRVGTQIVPIDPLFETAPSDGGDGWGDDPSTVSVDESANDDFGDLRPTVQSPALDSGDSSSAPFDRFDADGDGDVAEPIPFDLAGKPRRFGDSIDIGAYEYQSAISPVRETPSVLVNTLLDTCDPYDLLISLPEAVAYAGQDGLPTAIAFDSSLAGGTILLTGESIRIEKSLTIDVTPLGSLSIDADGKSNIFYLTEGDVNLVGLTLTGGNAFNGGAIYNEAARLTIAQCTITSNAATSCGGGIYNVIGTVTITDCTVSNDLAYNGGGIYYEGGNVTIADCAVSQNQGEGIYGIYGSLNVARSTISDNEQRGISVIHGTATVTDSTIHNNQGGGLFTRGTLMVTQSTISGNTASNGGGICNISGTLIATGNLINDNAATRGGGIYNDENGIVTITENAIQGNSAFLGGGGIYNGTDATLTVTSSWITDNSTSNDGGGIFVLENAALTVTSCMIADNSADGDGGGICTTRDLDDFPNAVPITTTLTNCMITGNSAGGDGGGIYNSLMGPFTMTNCTIAGNTTEEDGGGIFNLADEAIIYDTWVTLSGTVYIHNSIFWNNAANGNGSSIHYREPNVSDAEHILIDHSLIATPDGMTGIYGKCTYTDDDGDSLPGINPMFCYEAAGDYRLLDGSPAVDAGDNSLLPADTDDLDGDSDTDEPVSLDIAGRPRVYRAAVDMGAYENCSSGLFVESISPDDVVLTLPDPTITLDFSTELDAAIDYSAFVTAVSADPVVLSVSVIRIDADTLEIQVSGGQAGAPCTLEISPLLPDARGERLNQDRDETGGESADDLYLRQFTFINTHPWQNPNVPEDVNDDGYIVPLDALLVINYLNQYGSQPLPVPPPAGSYWFYDTNGDDYVAPIDALIVINYLNSHSTSAAPPYPPPVGEGEPPMETLSAVKRIPAADQAILLLDQLLADSIGRLF